MNSTPSAGPVRPAAVAGQFYPSDSRQLRAWIERWIAEAPLPPGPAPKAIIVPHAGYVFSGRTAAAGFACLAPDRALIRRVVLIGPAHRVPVSGLASSTAGAWSTPLGLARLDSQAVEHCPGVHPGDEAHRHEHCLEVQAPFLQVLFPDALLVPLLAGDAESSQIAAVLDLLWGGPETRVVISSDLSHYLDYEEAARLDAETRLAVEHLRPLRHKQACGRIPVNGLLETARRRRLSVETLALCNSGDTAGDRARVVGYGAWAFREP